MTIIRAPFTDDQIEALNHHQTEGKLHPLTCPGKEAHETPCPSRVLVATREGWVCACGEYRQDWAHQHRGRR